MDARFSSKGAGVAVNVDVNANLANKSKTCRNKAMRGQGEVLGERRNCEAVRGRVDVTAHHRGRSRDTQ